MPDYARIIIPLAFLGSCALTLGLILGRPYLRVRVFQRHLRIETYFLGALFGPLLILISGSMGFAQIMSGLHSGGLQPFGILSLFLSMVFISIFLDITGVFEYCARQSLCYAKNDGRRLFFSLYISVSLLTIFTSNDIIILTFTPFVYYIARHAKLNPVPYLIAEFFAANTWSMVLYVGNPTNILLAGAFHLDFIGYAMWMALPTVAAGLVNVVGLYLLFRRDLGHAMAPVDAVPPLSAITDRPGAVMGIILLAGCVVGLAVAPRLGIEMWVIALVSALGLLFVLIVRRSWAKLLKLDLVRAGGVGVRQTMGRMPWSIVPFVLSMFIAVEALRYAGITTAVGHLFAQWCGEDSTRLIFVYGVSSTFFANVLNNIPMTLAFASILRSLAGRSLLVATLATVIGSNLGANVTPIGALAGIMWMSILRDKAVHVGFGQFVRYGLLITPLSLGAALLVLAIEARLF